MNDPLAPTSGGRLSPSLPAWLSLVVSPERLKDTAAPLALAAALSSSLLVVVAHRLIAIERAWDYVFHIEAARLMRDGVLLPPHFLFHAAVIAVHALLPGRSWTASALVVLASFQILLVGMIFFGLLAPLKRRGVEGAGLAAGFLAFGLVTVSAVPLFALSDRHLYFGYVPTNTYHNPTIILLKPLALGLYLLVVRAFADPGSASGWRWGAAVAALSVASTLAKPLYTLCLLPTVVSMGAWRLWARRPVAWKLLLGCVVVPGVLALAAQSFLGARVQGSFQVVFAPFLFVGARSGWLLPKYLLSVLFPLTVCLVYRDALRRVELSFAWVSFLFGSFYTYFLAESGPRALDGNLSWAAQVSLFVLFYASVRACLEQHGALAQGEGGTRYGRGLLVCASAFALHLAAGVVWYYMHVALIFSW